MSENNTLLFGVETIIAIQLPLVKLLTHNNWYQIKTILGRPLQSLQYFMTVIYTIVERYVCFQIIQNMRSVVKFCKIMLSWRRNRKSNSPPHGNVPAKMLTNADYMRNTAHWTIKHSKHRETLKHTIDGISSKALILWWNAGVATFSIWCERCKITIGLIVLHPVNPSGKLRNAKQCRGHSLAKELS